MQSSGGVFIDVGKLDLRKYAGRPALAVALVDYLLFVEVNPRKGERGAKDGVARGSNDKHCSNAINASFSALELSSHSTEKAQFKSWLWKRRLGQAYYKLGLYRDAEKQVSECEKR